MNIQIFKYFSETNPETRQKDKLFAGLGILKEIQLLEDYSEIELTIYVDHNNKEVFMTVNEYEVGGHEEVRVDSSKDNLIKFDYVKFFELWGK